MRVRIPPALPKFNCHAQTDTYCGKNIKAPMGEQQTRCSQKAMLKNTSQCKSELEHQFVCVDCGKKNHKNALRCKTCSSKIKARKAEKIKWPSIENLLKMVDESNYTKVAKHLGVSDNAVRKRIRNH